MQYEEMLLNWNEKLNLTSITEASEVRIKHFIDSLTCFKILPIFGNYSLIDIGTGAGFPGIPLKIANPAMQLTLVESIGKKAEFCRLVVEELRLNEVNVITTRAESIGQDPLFREQFNFAVARAVSPLSVLAEYLLPLVSVSGSALAQKGFEISEELSSSKKAIEILGGEIKSIATITLPQEMGERTIIQIQKMKETPNKYPRRAGVPKKRPLNY